MCYMCVCAFGPLLICKQRLAPMMTGTFPLKEDLKKGQQNSEIDFSPQEITTFLDFQIQRINVPHNPLHVP